jgi:hypothetical protein
MTDTHTHTHTLTHGRMNIATQYSRVPRITADDIACENQCAPALYVPYLCSRSIASLHIRNPRRDHTCGGDGPDGRDSHVARLARHRHCGARNEKGSHRSQCMTQDVCYQWNVYNAGPGRGETAGCSACIHVGEPPQPQVGYRNQTSLYPTRSPYSNWARSSLLVAIFSLSTLRAVPASPCTPRHHLFSRLSCWALPRTTL